MTHYFELFRFFHANLADLNIHRFTRQRRFLIMEFFLSPSLCVGSFFLFSSISVITKKQTRCFVFSQVSSTFCFLFFDFSIGIHVLGVLPFLLSLSSFALLCLLDEFLVCRKPNLSARQRKSWPLADEIALACGALITLVLSFLCSLSLSHHSNS